MTMSFIVPPSTWVVIGDRAYAHDSRETREIIFNDDGSIERDEGVNWFTHDLSPILYSIVVAGESMIISSGDLSHD